jgi:xylan 1,4-beta-xylosidase
MNPQTIMKKIFFLLLLLPAFFCSAQNKLINPILPGFYPDPSIVKVGQDYYLINSTFAYLPGIPVFHSKDLNNWKQIGNVIDRPSQIDFMGEQLSRGLFAPAINYHKGIFYITCTDIDHIGNFVLTAKNPAGPWSDPIPVPEVHGIDPSLFFDGDQAYMIYNSEAPEGKALYPGHRTIRMYAFNTQTMKVKGEELQLVNGGVDLSKKPVWIEGPHLYKRGDYYYLLAAEGGTSVNHSQVAFRSKRVAGPYVPYENNPILTQKGLDPARVHPVTSTGHADLVEGPDGLTYAIFLGVRPYEGDYYNTGRETFIAPVAWESGWPIINPGNKEVQYAYQVKFPVAKQVSGPVQNSNHRDSMFFKGKLDMSLLFLRKQDPSWYRTGASGLTLSLTPETCMGNGNPAFIGRRQQHLNCKASTSLNFTPKAAAEKAGLTIFQNEYHFYYLCKSLSSSGKPVIQLFKGDADKKGMELIEEQELPSIAGILYLDITAHEGEYRFSYGMKKNVWKPIGPAMDAKFLSTRVAGGFVGSLFGLYATSSGQQSSNQATYGWLAYEGDDWNYKANQQ